MTNSQTLSWKVILKLFGEKQSLNHVKILGTHDLNLISILHKLKKNNNKENILLGTIIIEKSVGGI